MKVLVAALMIELGMVDYLLRTRRRRLFPSRKRTRKLKMEIRAQIIAMILTLSYQCLLHAIMTALLSRPPTIRRSMNSASTTKKKLLY